MLAFVELVIVGGAAALASKTVRSGNHAGIGCSSVLATLGLVPTLFLNSAILAGFNAQGTFWAKFGLVFGLPSLLGVGLLVLGTMAARSEGVGWRGVYSSALFGTLVFALWLLFAAAREYPLVLGFDPLVSALLSLVGVPLALIVALVVLSKFGIKLPSRRRDASDDEIRYIPPDQPNLN